MKKILSLLVMSFVLVMAVGVVGANTVESSTIVFEGALTDNGDGSYSGTIPVIEDGGFDVYANEEDTAIFADAIEPTEEVTISGHDAWPAPEWDPDTPDWDHYQLTLDGDDWYLEYFSGATTYANPMSGSMNWDKMYASEEGIGAYYEGTGTAEIDDGLGGSQAWDMDWSWGSEYVPLEYPGFLVNVEELGGENFRVSLIPKTIYSPQEGYYFKDSISIGWEGSFGVASLGYETGGCVEDFSTTEILQFGIATTGTYDWDTSGLEDGDYCIKIIDSDELFDLVEVTKDSVNPTADIAYTGSLIEGETITFDASGSSDGTGSGIETYEWDFADGDTSTGVGPTHSFTAGTYDVVLTVTDYAGNWDKDTVELIIAPIDYEEDEISFDAGILGILDLDESFDTEIDSVTCTEVGAFPDGLTLSQSGSECTLVWDDIPYEDRGVHEISIKAVNGGDPKYYNIEITAYTWMIDLVEGWNLISIPMMPEDTSIDSVFANVYDNIAYEGAGVDTVFQYDGADEDWDESRRYSDSSSYYGEFTGSLEIVPGYGYWVKMENADTLKGYGSMTPEMGGPMLGVDVANGWNLIGHFGLDDLPVADALTSLVLGSTNYYDSVSVTGNMQTGVGYWMTAKFIPDGETTYTPSQLALNSTL